MSSYSVRPIQKNVSHLVNKLILVFLDCCAQQRTYEKFYGLMAQRLCQINRAYVDPFEKIFVDCYSTVHRSVSYNRKNENISQLLLPFLIKCPGFRKKGFLWTDQDLVQGDTKLHVWAQLTFRGTQPFFSQILVTLSVVFGKLWATPAGAEVEGGARA